MTTSRIKVTQVRSVIGTKQSHRSTMRGLGLRRIGHTVVLADTAEVKGMAKTVSYLIKCEVMG